jgi:hypothetical protein
VLLDNALYFSPEARRLLTVDDATGFATANVNAAWTTGSASLNAFAGQTVRILIDAADAGGASLVEAAVDVKIVQQ